MKLFFSLLAPEGCVQSLNFLSDRQLKYLLKLPDSLFWSISYLFLISIYLNIYIQQIWNTVCVVVCRFNQPLSQMFGIILFTFICFMASIYKSLNPKLNQCETLIYIFSLFFETAGMIVFLPTNLNGMCLIFVKIQVKLDNATLLFLKFFNHYGRSLMGRLHLILPFL